MSQANKPPSIINLYPEETREAAELLKQAVPLMMRHAIPPNPVHYALWYTYSRGSEPELNRRLDKVVEDFDVFPRKPPAACFATTSSAANWKKHAPASNKSSSRSTISKATSPAA